MCSTSVAEAVGITLNDRKLRQYRNKCIRIVKPGKGVNECQNLMGQIEEGIWTESMRKGSAASSLWQKPVAVTARNNELT